MVSLLVIPWSVWWVDFDPQLGREQAGRRPAIVAGTQFACDMPNGLAVVVPCTSTDRQLPFHVAVNLHGRDGFAMCDQLKSISRQRFAGPHRTGILDKDEIRDIQFALRRIIDI